MLKPLIVSCALALLAGSAAAGEAATITTDALYSGALADGLAKLEPLAAADDPEAWSGVGAIRLTQTIEGLSQALYRHGFAVDVAAPSLGVGYVPPIAANPAPE